MIAINFEFIKTICTVGSMSAAECECHECRSRRANIFLMKIVAIFQIVCLAFFLPLRPVHDESSRINGIIIPGIFRVIFCSFDAVANENGNYIA